MNRRFCDWMSGMMMEKLMAAIGWPWLRRRDAEPPAWPVYAEPAAPRETSRTYRVANTSGRALAVFLEPWGGVYRLNAGDYAELLVEGPPDHPLDWEFGDGTLVIASHAADEGMLTLWHEGTQMHPVSVDTRR